MLVRQHLGRLVRSASGDGEEGVDEVDSLSHALLDEGSQLRGVASGVRHTVTVRRMGRRRQAAVLMAPVVLAGCALLPSATTPVPVPTPSAASTQEPTLADFYEQTPRWVNCGPAECATLEVPLDYDDPGGQRMELAITRVPATGERLGSLFVNPGGPGASAVAYAKAADSVVGSPIREHFDLIGVDPRGVGLTSPIECMSDAQLDELAAAEAAPDSSSEERALVALARMPGMGCATSSPDLIAHVGTVDSARDLDIARAAVGDPTLTYLGKSYGTLLGATYAELFPTRVGRMVLDGALPGSLTTEEVSRGQAIAFEMVLDDFIADCLTHDDCPLSGDVDAAGDQLRSWLDGLDDAPLTSGDREVTGALAAYAILTNLYVPDYDFPRLREALGPAIEDQDAAALLALLDSRISRGPDGRYENNSSEAFYAVSCLDRPYVGTLDDVRRLATEWGKDAPTFGPSLAWGLLACRDWPAQGEPVTRTRAEGAPPILVVSTRRDPATPFAWGVDLAEDLASARLLTYEGDGHTAYLKGSACVDDAVEGYLLAGKLPEIDSCD